MQERKLAREQRRHPVVPGETWLWAIADNLLSTDLAVSEPNDDNAVQSNVSRE